MEHPDLPLPNNRRNWPRAGLAAAGLLMLLSGFLPALELMGESATLYELAWNGFSSWCWVLAASGGLAMLAAGLRPSRWSILLAVSAAAGPIIVAGMGWRLMRAVFWMALRGGSYGLLAGALACLLCAGLQAAAAPRPHAARRQP